MSDHIRRIQEIDSQIKAVKKILQQGEFIGAGLAITLTVGDPNAENAKPVSVAISEGVSPVLQGILDGLESTRSLRVALARGELKDLQAFFSSDASAS